MTHLLAMGGYAAFVWPAYGVSMVGIVGAIALVWRAYARAKSVIEKIERDGGA